MRDDLAADIRTAEDGRGPFPFQRVGGLTVTPIYAVHKHHLMDLVCQIERLRAENAKLRDALTTISRVEFQENGWVECHEVLSNVRIAAHVALKET